MDAFATMNHQNWMFRELRPAGEAISIRVDTRDTESKLHRYFPDPMVFYQSGTAALAAGLIACKAAREIDHPEVLLPAYACPDLLSAVDYAGLQPVLIDFEENKPWMSIADMVAKINENTIAVIAVNFLGIPERIAEIRHIIDKKRIFLIEDRAQSMPGNSDESPLGDFVVLSFGKGKPVAVLHGGALLIKRRELSEYVPRPAQGGSDRVLYAMKQYLKIVAYNLLIQPRCYWALKYFPMTQLGETRYKPLSAIKSMDRACMVILEKNIRDYYERKSMAAYIHEMLISFGGNGAVNLPVACDCVNKKLLRYPLLLPSEEHRDNCLRSLEAKGLGASKMYPGVLPTIKGVSLPFVAEEYPNASGFAARLLTLPLHSDVTNNTVNEIAAVFQQCLRAVHS